MRSVAEAPVYKLLTIEFIDEWIDDHIGYRLLIQIQANAGVNYVSPLSHSFRNVIDSMFRLVNR